MNLRDNHSDLRIHWQTLRQLKPSSRASTRFAAIIAQEHDNLPLNRLSDLQGQYIVLLDWMTCVGAK
jgi:hypothetical protein